MGEAGRKLLSSFKGRSLWHSGLGTLHTQMGWVKGGPNKGSKCEAGPCPDSMDAPVTALDYDSCCEGYRALRQRSPLDQKDDGLRELWLEED